MSTNTPFGRDIARGFVDACREAGLKVGFCFSLMDWHHPDYTVDIGHTRRPQDKRGCEPVGRDPDGVCYFA